MIDFNTSHGANFIINVNKLDYTNENDIESVKRLIALSNGIQRQTTYSDKEFLRAFTEMKNFKLDAKFAEIIYFYFENGNDKIFKAIMHFFSYGYYIPDSKEFLYKLKELLPAAVFNTIFLFMISGNVRSTSRRLRPTNILTEVCEIEENLLIPAFYIVASETISKPEWKNLKSTLFFDKLKNGIDKTLPRFIDKYFKHIDRCKKEKLRYEYEREQNANNLYLSFIRSIVPKHLSLYDFYSHLKDNSRFSFIRAFNELEKAGSNYFDLKSVNLYQEISKL